MRSATYRPDIDGLRAIAVLLVVGYHAFPKLAPGGYIGVDVFFVISGYLITGIILDPLADGAFSFRDFYRRRIRRIFPALLVVLTATLALGYHILAPAELASLAKHTLAATGFVSNLAYWKEAGYFDTAAETKPLLHLWSLGVEEQFYIAWPATLFVITRLKLPARTSIALLGLASFAGCLAYAGTVSAFYAPYFRAWELLAGAMLVTFNVRWRWAAAIGLPLILIAVALLTPTSTFPGWWAVLPVLGTAAVIASGSDAPVNRVLSLPALVAIGLISYPLYLWHWPLLSFANTHAAGEPGIVLKLCAVAGAFVLAALTYWLVEGNLRRTRTWRPSLGLVAGMAMISAVALFVYNADGFADSVSDDLQPLAAYNGYDIKFRGEARADVCWLAPDDANPVYPSECSPSTPGGIVVWGDSYAARLYPGLRAAFGDKVGQYTRSLCLPLPQPGPCGATNNLAIQAIQRLQPKTVIIYGSWGFYPEGNWTKDADLGQALLKSLEALAGVPQVIVLGPAPRWKLPLPTLLYQEGRIPARLATGLDDSVFAIDARMRKLSAGGNVRYVSLLDFLCTAEGCLTHPPDQPTKLITWDTGHFTIEGATFVTQNLLKPLQ